MANPNMFQQAVGNFQLGRQFAGRVQAQEEIAAFMDQNPDASMAELGDAAIQAGAKYGLPRLREEGQNLKANFEDIETAQLRQESTRKQIEQSEIANRVGQLTGAFKSNMLRNMQQEGLTVGEAFEATKKQTAQQAQQLSELSPREAQAAVNRVAGQFNVSQFVNQGPSELDQARAEKLRAQTRQIRQQEQEGEGGTSLAEQFEQGTGPPPLIPKEWFNDPSYMPFIDPGRDNRWGYLEDVTGESFTRGEFEQWLNITNRLKNLGGRSLGEAEHMALRQVKPELYDDEGNLLVNPNRPGPRSPYAARTSRTGGTQQPQVTPQTQQEQTTPQSGEEPSPQPEQTSQRQRTSNISIPYGGERVQVEGREVRVPEGEVTIPIPRFGVEEDGTFEMEGQTFEWPTSVDTGYVRADNMNQANFLREVNQVRQTTREGRVTNPEEVVEKLREGLLAGTIRPPHAVQYLRENGIDPSVLTQDRFSGGE